MAIQLENEIRDTAYFEQNLPVFYRTFLKNFKKTSRGFLNFNVLFIAIFCIELTLFTVFFPFLTQSTILAYSLSALFLTCFCYFILLFYLQAQKPDQFAREMAQFVASCKGTLPAREDNHLAVAEALSKLSAYLHDFEWNFYKIPASLEFLTPWVSRFSAYSYRKDVFAMKEILLSGAVFEHIEQVKATPTDLEVHASLAGTYVALSKLHREHPDKAQRYSKLAIEEFKILSHYAGSDPWIHEQMALGYRELNIPEEEIKEIEVLLKLRPHDKEILFQLGSLYFRQGCNAKGLQVYEDLKRTHFKKAEELIALYGNPADQ